MFPLFSANYVDNYWIKDRTFFSDMKLGLENAFLGMELSGLHNWQISPFNTSFYDTNSLFTQFLETSAKNAQAMTENMFCGFPGLNFQMPTIPGVTTTTPNKEIEGKKVKEDLTDEEKEEFNTLKEEFKDLYDSLDEIDTETKEALELNKILKEAKKCYDASDTPDKMQKCIDKLKSAIRDIEKKDKNLKKILNKVTAEVARDSRAEKLYNSNTSKEEIKGLFEPAANAAIKKENILSEIDLSMSRKEGNNTSPINALVSRSDAKKSEIQNAIKAVKNALLDRANMEDVKECENVINAKDKLIDAFEKYSEKINDDNKKALVEAFENLYKEIKLAKARRQDEANRQKILDLPKELQELYLDENGMLKDKFKINETSTVNELKEIKGGTPNDPTPAADDKGKVNYSAAQEATFKPSNNKEESATPITFRFGLKAL